MAQTQTISERAGELAARVAARQGCELVHCEYRREGSDWVLRVFIEREGGVDIDDCATVSRQLSTLLDVEDLIPHAYNLEVSSPGLDRPLRGPDDYRKFRGERVRVKTYASVRGRRQFVGTLRDFGDEVLAVEDDDGQVWEVPLERVAQARLEPEL